MIIGSKRGFGLFEAAGFGGSSFLGSSGGFEITCETDLSSGVGEGVGAATTR
jgi:hypothetical protein